MTYYSRRQLEAFGEPLGDSVTRKEGGRIIYGGGGSGGGSPAPTQTTTYSTNVPEYARPYVEGMLEATQKQIYNPDMTTFRPYQPYSRNVSDYVAGFSPLQQRAQETAYGLETPGQIQAGTGLAGASGIGGLGLAGQMAGAGQQYAAGVTNPATMQAYMSPYQQGVTDIAKAAAVREAQIAQQTQNLAAARQGTYGGARQTLAQAERERNLLTNLSNIQAQGSQSAFDRAMQAQQFGANIGLQGQQAALGGLGAATQAAGTLGQLGGQQLGAQKEIIGLQSQMGAQQQALEQQKINQAIQDYAIAQQYPYMQLGLMNAMLRGLPLQTQTTQLYQAQPTAMQQGIGLLGAGASLFGGKAAGGAIKEYREGGITKGYKPGGVVDSTRADLEEIADMPGGIQRLEQIRNSSASAEVRKMATQIIMEKQLEARAAQQTQQARVSGIALGGGPAFESQTLAGGGIVAFDDGGVAMTNPEFGGGDQPVDVRRPMTVEELFREYPGLEGKVGIAQIQDYTSGRSAPPESARAKPAAPTPAPTAAPAPAAAKPPVAKEEGADTGPRSDRSPVVAKSKTLADFLTQQKELGPKGQYGEEFEKFLGDYVGDKDRLSRKERMAMAKGFLKFASTPSPGGIGQAAAAGLSEYATGVEAAREAEDKVKFETAKIKADIDKARRAEARGDVDAAQKAYDSAENRQLKVAEMQNQLKVAGIQASRSSDFERQYEAFKKDPAKFAEFRKSLTSQDDTARLNAYVKADEFIAKSYPNLLFSKKPEDIAKLDQIRKDKVTEYLGALGIGAPSAAPAAPQTNPDGTINIPGRGTFKQLPNGNYVKV